jgi:Fe-S-cluster-containing dehydrogenase component
MFGDRSDPQSAISKFMETERVMVLRPEMGTEPKVAYKGLDKEVR